MNQKAIRKAIKRPRGIAVTIRARLAKRQSGEEFSVVTIDFPKVVPSELWHNFKGRRRLLDQAHALFRHLVYQLGVPAERSR